MTAWVTVPILAPLFAAGVSVAVGQWRWAQRIVTLVTLTLVTGVGIALLRTADVDGATAVQAGDWAFPFGVAFVADRFAAAMVTVAGGLLLLTAVYAIGHRGAERHHVAFHPALLVLTAGTCQAFLTADLFNLFVAFEVLLIASYVLLTLGGRRAQVRAGMSFVVVNLLASSLLLLTLGFLYAATGTVHLADLATKVPALPDGTRTALAVLLLVAFGLKAALVPLFYAVPDAYPAAPAPVAAAFAGLSTKVGIYALARSQLVLLEPDQRLGSVLLVLAVITMIVGVAGAVNQTDIRRILSFHVVSQIGYLLMGLGLFTVAGIAGLVVYLVHYIPVKSALFMVTGIIQRRRGTTDLGRLSGLAHTDVVLAGLFLLPALSLAGIPPLSGFVGKLALVQAGVEDRQWWVVAASLAVGLLTLYSMTKIWAGAFWGPVDTGAPARADGRGERRDGIALMTSATAMLVVVTLAVALAAGPVHRFAERTAVELLDRSSYREAVTR